MASYLDANNHVISCRAITRRLTIREEASRAKGESLGDPSSRLKDNDSAAGAEENGLPEKALLARDYHENKDPLSAVSKYDRTFV